MIKLTAMNSYRIEEYHDLFMGENPNCLGIINQVKCESPLNMCLHINNDVTKTQTNTSMKFNIWVSLLLFLGLSLPTTAQSDGNSFKNGLYITFEDLKGNRVVEGLPYRQETLSSKDGVSRYEIYHQGKFRKIKRIYCFVNNDHIYLNSKKYGRKGYFVRSHFTGKYAYFEDRLGNDKFSYSRGVPSSNGPAVESKIWGILLDMDTGKVVKTSRRNMKKLLAPYPKLLDEYLESDKSTEKVKELIVWLNEKNK